MGVQEDLTQFEHCLTQLVIKYEQYFLGLEKREPLQLLNEATMWIRKYANVSLVNTMYKFKYNTLVARFHSYQQYWNRINRLIEEGKYSRERFKMEMHQGKPKTPAQAKPQEASSDPEVAKLFACYLEARKACHLSTDNISQDMIAAALEKQRPAIINKYHCKQVEFKVVIEEGTPKIKARPKT